MVVAAEETGGKSPLGLLYDMNRLLGVVCGVFFLLCRSRDEPQSECQAAQM